jgi:predicted class III extradiol MEMO1 family dioxygenase
MVEARMTKAVTNENSETGFGSLRIVKGVDRQIYISDTDMEEGHRLHSIEHTIYVQIYLWIPIDLLDLEVKP